MTTHNLYSKLVTIQIHFIHSICVFIGSYTWYAELLTRKWTFNCIVLTITQPLYALCRKALIYSMESVCRESEYGTKGNWTVQSKCLWYMHSFVGYRQMNIIPGMTMRNRLCDHRIVNKQTLVNIVKWNDCYCNMYDVLFCLKE